MERPSHIIVVFFGPTTSPGELGMTKQNEFKDRRRHVPLSACKQ